MKRIFYLAALMMVVGLLWAATPPAPPANISNPLLPPAGMILITNTTQVYTNTAVKTPTITFQNVTIYGGTNALKGATIVSWSPSPDTNMITGYNLYWGPTNNALTNKFPTLPYVTTVLFYGILDTNAVYWAYATAVSGTNESAPSNAIMVTGGSHF